MSFCPKCDKCPVCCKRSTCGRPSATVLAGLALPGFKSKGSLHPQGRVSTTFQGETTPSKISCNSQWFIKSFTKQKSERGIAFSRSKTGYRKGVRSVISGFLQPVVLGSKPQRKMEAHSRSKPTEPLPCSSNVQDGNSGDHQTLPAAGGVGHFARFQGRLFSHSDKPQVAKISKVSHQTSDFSVHSTSLWPVDGSVGVHKGGQRGKTYGSSSGYSDPPIPRRLVTESPVSGNVPTSYPDPFGPLPLSGLGCQHHFDLSQGLVKPTQERWRSLSQKLNLLLGLQSCTVRQFMSLIGLLTATEKQVVSGRLHMRPIQWHLKRHWRVPESLEKIIPIPSSLHVHLRWWLDPTKVLSGQPLHPLRHALQLFTDASNEGWGAHLGDYMAKGVWSESESALHINLLELKAVLLALKWFERLCYNQVVLVCTDNTTVVSYINKEGGMRSGSLCALLWRLMLWCNQRQIVLRARHIPGHLNVIADKLSRLNQVIQTEWSLLPEVFAQLCRRWHLPSVDLFATRFNHKLPKFVSPVPDQSAWAVDALSLHWEKLDAYAFPPTALLSQVVTKLLDHGFRHLILIAPGWPNMPWFWDLVRLSTQISLLLPQVSNLITQPFNQCPHRDLPNLNLHAWLLEPPPLNRQGFLQKWQQELRLLKDDLPEPSMNQSGPYLSDGATRVRWTSGLPL